MTLVGDLGRRASFRLGAVEVRPSACEIDGPGGRMTLEPRVMQVLVTLADAGGETVTRDELIEACWDGRIVSQDAINRVMLRIRRAERGAAAGAFTLQTIPKIGFRLLVGEAAADLRTAPPAAGPRLLRRPAIWAGAVLSLLLAGGLALVVGAVIKAPSAPAAVRDTSTSPEVRDLAARGTAALFEATPQQTAQGVNYFRAAVREAPNNPRLWGSLAMASVLNQPNLAPSDQRAATARIREAAERALELDPHETHAWAALTSLTPTFGGWTAKADLVARARAHAEADGPPTIRQQVLFLAATGRMRDGLASAERLNRLHSTVPFIKADLLRLLAANGRFEAADAVAAQAAQLWPRDQDLWRARFDLALAERDGAAAAMAADRAAWPPQTREADMARRSLVARALASGRADDADGAMAAYLRDPGEGQGYLEEGIVAAAALNRPDAAFRLAARLYGKDAPAERLRFTDHVEYAVLGDRKTDIWFGPFAARLWSDPRFLPLMDQIGLAAYWRDRDAPDLCATPALQAACRKRGIARTASVAALD